MLLQFMHAAMYQTLTIYGSGALRTHISILIHWCHRDDITGGSHRHWYNIEALWCGTACVAMDTTTQVHSIYGHSTSLERGGGRWWGHTIRSLTTGVHVISRWRRVLLGLKTDTALMAGGSATVNIVCVCVCVCVCACEYIFECVTCDHIQ